MKTNIATDLANEIEELKKGKSVIQFLVNNLKETYQLQQMSTLKVNTTLISEDFSQSIVINETHSGETYSIATIDHYVEGQRISRRRIDGAKCFDSEVEENYSPSTVDLNTLSNEDFNLLPDNIKNAIVVGKQADVVSVQDHVTGVTFVLR